MGEKAVAAPTSQKYKQQVSIRFNTFAEAEAVRLTYGKKGRHRIRRRPDDHFDLITYTEV